MAGMSWTTWAGTGAVPSHDQSTLRGRMIQIGSPPSTRRSSSIRSPGPTSSSSHKRRGRVAWRFAVKTDERAALGGVELGDFLKRAG